MCRYYKRRREWFEELPPPYSVLWLRHTRDLPTMAEAFERLRYLQEHGPTEWAFNFKTAKQFLPTVPRSTTPLHRRGRDDRA